MAGPALKKKSLTADEFLVYPTPEGRSELVRGEVQLSPSPGGSHGILAVAILKRLVAYVDANNLGRVFMGAGFELVQLPRTVRAPDVSFVRQERLPPGRIGRGYPRLVPDLAVEIRSPSDRPSRLKGKLEDYDAVGIPLVWVLDEKGESITTIAGGQSRVLHRGDTLDGAPVLPGFSCTVSELFDELLAP